MQDLEFVFKPEHIEFQPHNLVMPWSIHERCIAVGRREDNKHLQEKSLCSILNDNGRRFIPTVYYLPERNLILSSSNKTASVSIQRILTNMYNKTGEEPITLSHPFQIIELINKHNPEVWHIYRDPLMRMVSYFYYIGRQQFNHSGVRWSWEGLDMYTGNDTHRRPQFANIPGYFKGENINERIKIHIDQNLGNKKQRGHCVPYDVWAYPFLGDFIPHKNVKFFWLHEKEVTDRTNTIELIYQKLGIEYQHEPGNNEIICNRSFRPDLKDIPQEHIQRICQAQQPEREFLNRLQWENGPIQFYGLS